MSLPKFFLDLDPYSAWIGSIQYALVFFPGLIVGRCFDLGYFRPVFLISSLLVVGTTFLIPQCKEYWHFLICQGIVLGVGKFFPISESGSHLHFPFDSFQIGCGGVFSPTPAVVAHWFKRRRGFAMGFVAAGASIGGAVLPVTAWNLLPQVGYVVPLVDFMSYIFFCQFCLDNAYIRLPATDCAWSCELGEFVCFLSLLIGLLKFCSF